MCIILGSTLDFSSPGNNRFDCSTKLIIWCPVDVFKIMKSISLIYMLINCFTQWPVTLSSDIYTGFKQCIEPIYPVQMHWFSTLHMIMCTIHAPCPLKSYGWDDLACIIYYQQKHASIKLPVYPPFILMCKTTHDTRHPYACYTNLRHTWDLYMRN